MKRFLRTLVYPAALLPAALLGALVVAPSLVSPGASATTQAPVLPPSWGLRIASGDDGMVQEITRSDGVLCLVGVSRYGSPSLLCAEQTPPAAVLSQGQ